MTDPYALIGKLRDSVASVFLGNPESVERLICCMLARGHALLEDVPGVGKTVLAHALARSVDCAFSRIQLTPDLLPGDIVGVTVFNRDTQAFHFKKGPLFANIVLADEINRTPPRTQTALLEAMNESSVTVDGSTHILEQPFMVVATQNPSDFEGTYPLPENQLDRFLMRFNLGYPSAEDEARILDVRPAENALRELRPVMTGAEVTELQRRVDAVRLDRSLVDYIIALANATRTSQELRLGLSPRGSLALAQAARATAVLRGRDYVVPEDVLWNVGPVCAHRVLGFGGAGGIDALQHAEAVISRLLDSIPAPA
jgi:MoxR-like ATPase